MKCNKFPPTFAKYEIYAMTQHTGTSDIVFSTDMYKEHSVKSMERKRRGCAEKIILKGESTKKDLQTGSPFSTMK
jgi:hypothetical protein